MPKKYAEIMKLTEQTTPNKIQMKEIREYLGAKKGIRAADKLQKARYKKIVDAYVKALDVTPYKLVHGVCSECDDRFFTNDLIVLNCTKRSCYHKASMCIACVIKMLKERKFDKVNGVYTFVCNECKAPE